MRTVNIDRDVSRDEDEECRKVWKDGRMRGVGWRESAKRDFSTAQADSFADERGERRRLATVLPAAGRRNDGLE